MTCIVGLIDQESGKVIMGADSLGTSDQGGASINSYKKLFRVGDFLIGCAGSPRPGQLLRYAFNPPEYNSDEYDPRKDSIACYMVTKVVDAIKECIDAAKLKEEDKSYFLIGFKGRLFGIYPDDYQVEEDECGYNAIGASTHIALGSLWTTRAMGYTARTRVELALQASAEHNVYVRGPFIIESI
jgi:ATP-dependent protease HslVU (ClpYQ) peptidase subunit